MEEDALLAAASASASATAGGEGEVEARKRREDISLLLDTLTPVIKVGGRSTVQWSIMKRG